MLIATDCLFFAAAVFLHSIELMSSQPTTLEDLFPGYNGIMPPVKELQFVGQFRNFENYGKKRIKYPSRMLARRDHIIFGVPWGWYRVVHDPCVLFPHLRNKFLAFDINEEKWMTLPRDLSEQLGFNRFFQLLVARDEVAATHVTTSTNPVYRAAHAIALKEANDRADTVEREQMVLLNADQTRMDDSIRVLKEEYSTVYNREIMIHLHPRGEIDIHGYRRRHP